MKPILDLYKFPRDIKKLLSQSMTLKVLKKIEACFLQECRYCIVKLNPKSFDNIDSCKGCDYNDGLKTINKILRR